VEIPEDSMVVRSRALVPLLAAALVAAGLTFISAQELNERCGGRSQQPTVPCQGDVTKMMAALAKVPATPPAKPQQPRKVLIWSRIPSSGYQHSSIPLAAKLIEELGKKTGAWTSDTAWDLQAMSAQNLAQYDAIFLSSTTGDFLDDADQAATAARRKALLDFIRGGKGIAGIHATGDSYHGSPKEVAGGAETWPEWDRIIGGYFKFHWSYPTPITVKLDDPSNPINAPFKGRSFNVNDEIYTFAGWRRDNVHVLMSIDYDNMSDADRGREQLPRADHDYALAWVRPEGKGRLFYQALGHHESLYYNDPAFLQHIVAGMQYALGDLKVDDSIKGAK
jgi:type 1 glutamine amidotransferase